MKKVIITSLLALLCPLISSAQTFNDYVAANINPSDFYEHSLIRSVNSTSILVHYHDNNLDAGIIALIDQSRYIYRIQLPGYSYLNDLRIVDQNVYFCGIINSKPAIGHVKLTEFSHPAPHSITYYTANTGYISNIEHLVAYDIGGLQKVVAVGYRSYVNNPIEPCEAGFYIPGYENYTCLRTVVIEADFSGATLLYDSHITTNDTNETEIIDNVVETPNYVAFTGYYNNLHSIIIHRCDKISVLSSFSNDGFYGYYTTNERLSKFKCCYLNGDTIALASLSTYYNAGIQEFSTNVRLFDLRTMANTHAQLVPLNTKSEPYDLLYMPDQLQLILLQQNIFLPSTGREWNTFVHLLPYDPITYPAKCWYKTHDIYTFHSIDRLANSLYGAIGGNSLCTKELNSIGTNSCYNADNINVSPIGTLPETYYNRFYFNLPILSPPTPHVSNLIYDSIITSCFQP